MLVAPLPIVILRFAILLAVLTVLSPLLRQIIPLSAIFLIVPVVIVAVVPIIDSDLHAAFLRSRACQCHGWCCENSSEDKETNISTNIPHEEILQA
jgi:hypothetical protein